MSRDFLIVANETAVRFNNAELNKATNKIFKLGNNIRKCWYEVAYVVAKVDESGCYVEDGFDSVHEWVSKTFGLKKSASYTLLSIGKEYTKQILSDKGNVVGYGSNLPVDGNDFSKTQLEKMLPLGHDKAVELVESGRITPSMTVEEIKKIVKEENSVAVELAMPEPETESATENNEIAENVEPVDHTEEENEEMIKVFANDGSKYLIPISILIKYELK